MAVDFAERLDLAPELRMASYAYRAEFGRPPAVVRRVPGMVTLLTDGLLRLTVATPWGAIAAAGSRVDDIIELIQMERPGERERLTVAEAAAGSGPEWAGNGLRSARAGATLLISSELPEGCGVGVAAAAETAIRLSLGGAASPGGLQERSAGPHALLEGRRLPFDLYPAGLRLVIIDTRVREVPRSAPAEHAPVKAASQALEAGALTALGPMLTAAHKTLDCDYVQQIAVSMALRAGALGARMITDGPGRPVCALVPVGRLADVRAGVTAEFARRRLRSPRFLTFIPADGPQRV
jgi:galactokinase